MDTQSIKPILVSRQMDPSASEPTGASRWEISVGICANPYLADHGFQDMIVLPGSLYVEIAARIYRELFAATPSVIQSVLFRNPVILSDEATTILATAKRKSETVVECVFREAADAERNPGAQGQYCAKVEINEPGTPHPAVPADTLQVPHFIDSADKALGQERFYSALRSNGNQYGPRFQNLRGFWRSGDRVLGKLSVPRIEGAAYPPGLPSTVLDSITQVLAGFRIDEGRTFVLASIEKIELHDRAFPDTVWAMGRIHQGPDRSENGFSGDIHVVDEAGKMFAALTGVRFTLLDRLQTATAVKGPETSFMIASTFTAEPLEESLWFWGDFWGIPIKARFAPYNQVFQELLNPDSVLRNNRDGLNAILLRLEDWAVHAEPRNLNLTQERADVCFKDQERCTLPNGLEIAHLNRHETEYLYQEIFKDKCYLRHGVQLRDDGVVIDVGANIGLFSLFAGNCSPRASIYAFEPSPVAFRALQANCQAYGARFYPYNVGVSDRKGTARLTSYTNSSVFSSFHADAVEDRRAIEAVVANMVQTELGATADVLEDYVQPLTTGRLEQQTFECRVLGVSDIIRENGLTRVDLLKVDAEKSELDILRGIEESHWPIIDQVVVEVHDRSRKALEKVQEILFRRGFHCAVEEEKLLADSGLFNVYATRAKPARDCGTISFAPDWSTGEMQSKANEFIAALEVCARSSTAPMVLCLCPGASAECDGAGRSENLAPVERDILQRAGLIPNVHVIGSDAIGKVYGPGSFFDPHAHELGHIPYTAEGFAAIGTSLFRAFCSMRRRPYKAIVLDCDNTLWHGACGEEGPLAVEITETHKGLQQFMLDQMRSGMLICLCSKNNEPDVWEVFGTRSEMVLKREHLASWRINWTSKSQNLKSLAQELGIGLESIIFIDDNPVECGEVRSSCPELLTLQLPKDPADYPRFLAHVWAFDHAKLTEEDRKRTRMLQENLLRTKELEQAPSLKDFIEGLHLQVSTLPPSSDQIDRIAQLTQRTNQFNVSTIRRSEHDILHCLAKESVGCLVARVSDRFGDYGLVGVILWELDVDTCRVDTFLLSCRVLGRGVEHQILAEVGRRALIDEKRWIEVLYRPSGKNQPAWQFLNSLKAESKREIDGGILFRFPAEEVAAVRYAPDNAAGDSAGALGKSLEGEPKRITDQNARPGGTSWQFQRTAEELWDLSRLVSSIDSFRLDGNGAAQPEPVTATSLEGKLLNVWRRVLGNRRVGPTDNFFEVGGTSLKAVLAVAAVRRELHLNLTVVSFFESPTVRSLCERLDPRSNPSAGTTAALERGARRKRKLVRSE